MIDVTIYSLISQFLTAQLIMYTDKLQMMAPLSLHTQVQIGQEGDVIAMIGHPDGFDEVKSASSNGRNQYWTTIKIQPL